MVVEPSAGPSSASEDSKENLAEMGPEAPDSFFNIFLSWGTRQWGDFDWNLIEVMGPDLNVRTFQRDPSL